MADLVKISSGYEAVLKEISDLQERVDRVDRTYSSRPSRFLSPEADGELLHMFPTTRVYNQLSAGLTDMVAVSARFILHLELLQLYSLAMGASDVDDSAEQRSFARRAFFQVHMATSHDCDVIIESFEQFLRPGAGIFLGAGKVPFPITVAAGYLAKTRDPRLQYILTVVGRYQAESGFPLADLLHDVTGLRCPTE